MSDQERRALILRQWAMRAADKVNGVHPARAMHLGDQCDYARAYMGHTCWCGERRPTWAKVYSHVTATRREEGISELPAVKGV